MFLFSFLLVVGLDRAQNTKGVDIQMPANQAKHLSSHIRQTMYTVTVCSTYNKAALFSGALYTPLKFVELHNQLVNCSTTYCSKRKSVTFGEL